MLSDGTLISFYFNDVSSIQYITSMKARQRKRDIFKSALRDLASLSLVDYKWRSALFKKNEADRMEEEWMARMMGEDPAYARPMDADDTKRGPLGRAEKSAVQWLMDVIEEEGKRAKRIAESDGELVRPKDNEEGGPLSDLERKAVQFLADITDSEVDRVRSGTVRPKDMTEKGPLGKAETRAVLALQKGKLRLFNDCRLLDSCTQSLTLIISLYVLKSRQFNG